MAYSNDQEILFIIAMAVFLAIGSYLTYYPLPVKKWLSTISSRKGKKEIIAGYSPAKIRVAFDLSPNEKSQILTTMRNLLSYDNLRMTGNEPFDRLRVTPDHFDKLRVTHDGLRAEQLTIPFIPEDDEQEPDLIHDDEGPEVTEEDELSEDFVTIGDLLKQ